MSVGEANKIQILIGWFKTLTLIPIRLYNTEDKLTDTLILHIITELCMAKEIGVVVY